MALQSTSRPSIRGRVLARIPAKLKSKNGFKITKANGDWTIEPDFSQLTVVNVLDTPEDKQFWAYDPVTQEYVVIAVQALIANLPAGPQGIAGPPAGIKQNYSNVIADADPGAGAFRLNHATPGSATAIYLDNVDAGGGSITAIVDKYDDSTNVSAKGFLRIEDDNDPSVWAEFTVTGAVVDGGGYRKLTLAGGSHAGVFVDGTAFRISFFRSGDKGTDGVGTGDVTAAAVFGVDNRLVRSDGTGKGVQASGISIDDSNNVSGVAALSATDTATIEKNDAANNAVTRPLVLRHKTSGAPAVGIGVGVQFETETATSENVEIVGVLDVVGTDITGATEDFDFVGKLMAAGAAVAEVFRVTSLGVMTLAGNAARIVLHAAGGATLTGGFNATSYNGGNITGAGQTYTPNPLNGNFQHVTLNGSSLTGTFTFAVPGSTCSIMVEVLNSGSGAVGATLSTSGYDKVTGDAYATTNGNKYLFIVTRSNSYKHLHIQALQ